MIRFILNTLVVMLALRFLFLSARFITSLGRLGQGPASREPGGTSAEGESRDPKGDTPRAPRIDRSGAIDVPFTEITAEPAVKSGKPADGESR